MKIHIVFLSYICWESILNVEGFNVDYRKLRLSWVEGVRPVSQNIMDDLN